MRRRACHHHFAALLWRPDYAQGARLLHHRFIISSSSRLSTISVERLITCSLRRQAAVNGDIYPHSKIIASPTHLYIDHFSSFFQLLSFRQQHATMSSKKSTPLTVAHHRSLHITRRGQQKISHMTIVVIAEMMSHFAAYFFRSRIILSPISLRRRRIDDVARRAVITYISDSYSYMGLPSTAPPHLIMFEHIS